MERTERWNDDRSNTNVDDCTHKLLVATEIKSVDEWSIPLVDGSLARVMNFTANESGGKSVQVLSLTSSQRV